MKTSVIVIAHNEEKHIGKCLDSISRQTVKADEVIVVAHNCTDKTENIASKYTGINVVSFKGPAGIVHARMEGVKVATGDIVLYIDSDAYAKKNWVFEMTKTLSQNNNVMVGSWVKFKGTAFGFWANFINKYRSVRKDIASRMMWGASIGFFSKDKERVLDIFAKSIDLSKQLGLTRNPEDYWLALFMEQYGNIEVTNKTSVTSITKEISSNEAARRSRENVRNGKIMETYFKHHA